MRRSSLGDVVLLGAVTSSILGHVTVVTDTRWREVVERLKGVDAVVNWPERAEALPRGRIIDLQGNSRSRRLVRNYDVVRVNKRSLRRRARMFFPAIGPRPSVREVYAEACDVEVAPLPWIELHRKASELLVLVPGAAWRTKRWAPQRFVDLGLAWSGDVVVIGGPGEEVLCREISAKIEGSSFFVEQGFSKTFQVLEQAAVVVGGDTGLLHLAGACGVPVVTLFGPTHRADGFFDYPGQYLENELFCRPCTLHGRHRCPLLSQRCMEHSVADVLEAAEEARCAG